MIKKEKIMETFMELKKIIYVEKDEFGTIVFPTEKDSLTLYKEILQSKVTNGKNQFYHKKSKTWYQISIKKILDEESSMEHTLEFFEDITDIKKEERKLKLDSLTNVISDRNECNRLINDYIKYAKEHDEEFSVFMCDLDDFKEINDTYGHACGDIVLKEIGSLLLKTTRQSEDEFDDRKNDIVTRVGGDEFLLLIKDIDLVSTEEKTEVLNQAVSNLNVNYEGIMIPVTMSFGYYHVSKNQLEHTKDLDMMREDISKKADERLYETKKQKKSKDETDKKGMK